MNPRPHSCFAVTRARAAKRETMLKAILPRSIADLVSVARSGTIWYRGVIVGNFLPGGTMIAGRDHKVISVSDHKSLTRLFRGVFFPADYDNARDALNAHEARREPIVVG